MYKIATIGGDGIGPEIVAEGKKVLEAAGERFNFDIQWTDFDIVLNFESSLNSSPVHSFRETRHRG